MSTSLLLEPHRAQLWWLCYRMTGVAADADELVQETFLRALESPPREHSRELLPWLRRVAINAATDLLRRRKVRGYRGEWLPSPVELEQLPAETLSPSARYGQHESLSYAFLIALEVLSPEQRAIVILRDVLDYSVRETAEVLSISEANVKTQHHRARAALSSYDESRRPVDAGREGRARAAMLRLFAFVAAGDTAAVERLLSASVRVVHDADGEFHAAGRVLNNPYQVARMMVRLTPKLRVVRAQAGMFNGLPGMLVRTVPHIAGAPPLTLNAFDVDDRGLVCASYSVVATRKLSHLTFSRA